MFKRASRCVRKLLQGCFCGAAQGAGHSRGWAALSWVQPSLLSSEQGQSRSPSRCCWCLCELQEPASSTWKLWAAEVCDKAEAEAVWGRGNTTASCLWANTGCYRAGIRRKGHKNQSCEHAAQLGRVEPQPWCCCAPAGSQITPAALSSSFLQLAAAEHMCQLAEHQYPARPLIQTRPRPRRSQAASAQPQGCTEHPRAAGQEGSPLPPPPLPHRRRTPSTELLGPARGGRALRETGDARSTAVAAATPCRLPKRLPALVQHQQERWKAVVRSL